MEIWKLYVLYSGKTNINKNKIYTRGKTSNIGPIHRIMSRIKNDETTDAICVFPPVISWIRERDRDVAFGRQAKIPPTRLLRPYTKSKMFSDVS